MKKLITALCISTSVLFAGMQGKDKVDLSVYDDLKLEAILKFMATEVSKQIPLQMDKITTLVRTFSYNNTLMYTKEVATLKDKNITELLKTKEGTYALEKEAYKQDRNIVCNERILNYLMKTKGAIIEYQWQDENSKPLFNYTVEYKDCK